MAAIARASTNSRSMRALPSPARPTTAASMNLRTSESDRAAVPARPFHPLASSTRKSSSARAGGGSEQRAGMPRERYAASVSAGDNRIERARQRPLEREVRDEQQSRQLRRVGEVIEPGRDHGLSALAIDERRTERSIRMR